MPRGGTGNRTELRVKEEPGGGPAGGEWWMICRSGVGRVEAMTLPCWGGEALALFGHEEEAEIFLRSLGAGGSSGDWWVRESRCGEVASVLCGPCANAQRVTLDPPPAMPGGWMVEIASVDRGAFLAYLLARGGTGQGTGRRAHENAASPRRTLRAASSVSEGSARRGTMRREERGRTWVARGKRDL